MKNKVLHDICLKIEEGSFNSIIGQSGSGKSTLLNIIGTLDKSTSGEVYIDGKKTNRMTKKELAVLRNNNIGFIFQFHYLLPEFTVLENVLIPYKMYSSNKKNLSTNDAKKRAEELIDLVGLSSVKNKKANMISGGQQQRTAIARALMNSPKIILADEPTGNLDSDTTESIYNLLRDINEKLNTTFIIITHDRRIAEKTDRIIEIKDGRIETDIKK
ncbi:Lipoprotein-releasing system ATP-binding protein LolD [compost metagenome]